MENELNWMQVVDHATLAVLLLGIAWAIAWTR